MTFFTASIQTIILRFYLMMGVVIASFFAGFPIFAILALPIFLSIMAGVSFGKVNPPQKVKVGAKQTVMMPQSTTPQQKVA